MKITTPKLVSILTTVAVVAVFFIGRNLFQDKQNGELFANVCNYEVALKYPKAGFTAPRDETDQLSWFTHYYHPGSAPYNYFFSCMAKRGFLITITGDCVGNFAASCVTYSHVGTSKL